MFIVSNVWDKRFLNILQKLTMWGNSLRTAFSPPTISGVADIPQSATLVVVVGWNIERATMSSPSVDVYTASAYSLHSI